MKKIISVILIFAIVTGIAGTSGAVPLNPLNLIEHNGGEAEYEEPSEDTEDIAVFVIDRSTYNFTIFDALDILKAIVGIEELNVEKRQLYDFFDTGMIDIFNALEILKWLVWMDNAIGENPNPRVPSAPQNFTGIVGNGQVSLSWSAPKDMGNRAFLRYEISNGGSSWINVAGNTSYTFTGLTTGVRYTFSVRAVSIAGNGQTASVSAILGTIPSAPQTLNATPGDKKVTLMWNAPSNNGGASVTHYEVSNNDGNTWVKASANNTHTFTGLTNGQSYTFAVRAVNIIGAGAISRVSSTPKAPAQPPPPPPPPPPQPPTTSELAEEVIRLVNVERNRMGLTPLYGGDTRLNAAANKRAEEIVSKFEHERPNGTGWSTVIGEYGIVYSTAGENIAMGYGSAAAVMNGWMNSSGHRANILQPLYSYIGVGVVRVGNTLYWVQLFTG